MTARNDVAAFWLDSPRILEIASPSTEFVVQDMVDTSRLLETQFQGMSYPHLINAAGKEDLGGGVRVGITATWQNAQFAFEGRTTPAETGTVSTNPGSPVAGRDSFTDSSATFIANNVARGSLVINFTDQSIAEVVSVDSETKLTTKTLVNGIGNTYDVSDVYHVFNVIQCTALGGNSVAVDDVGGTISSILPTAFTQVLLTASSSATTQELEDIQYSSFDGAVHIDVAGGTTGTAYPRGTPREPVNNLADALSINTVREFDALDLLGDFTLANGESVSGFDIRGGGVTFNVQRTKITLESGCSTSNAHFTDCYITGVQGGETRYDDCIIEDLSNSHCSYRNCGFIGSLTMPAGGFDTHTKDVIDCFTGRSMFTWDMNGSLMEYRFVRFSGDITFTNGTSASATVYFHGDGGSITIDASCTASTFIISGDVEIINNSATATVTDKGTYTKLLELWARLGLDPSNDMTTNDDNSITVGGITIAAVNGATSTTQTRSGDL